MRLSVVVPTRNRADVLEQTVRAALADQATSELIVVDDGSSDDTPALLTRLSDEEGRLRSIRSEGKGVSVARQLGLEAATGEVVLMIDDDVELAPGTAAGHLERHALADPGGDLVMVGYMPIVLPESREPGQFATYFYAREYERRVGTWEQGSDVLDNLWLGNVSARRETWLEARLDDPDYPVLPHQDRDLGLRMKAMGFVGRFDRSLGARHLHERNLEQFLRLSYQQGLARWHLARLHGTRDAEDSALGGDLPRPFAVALKLGDSTLGTVFAERLLLWLVRIAGQSRLWSIEDAAAKALRRLALRRGARAHLTEPPATPPA